jgi:hypothetical protein
MATCSNQRCGIILPDFHRFLGWQSPGMGCQWWDWHADKPGNPGDQFLF